MKMAAPTAPTVTRQIEQIVTLGVHRRASAPIATATPSPAGGFRSLDFHRPSRWAITPRVIIAAARSDIAAVLAEQRAATASNAVFVPERIVRVALTGHIVPQALRRARCNR